MNSESRTKTVAAHIQEQQNLGLCRITGVQVLVLDDKH